MTQLKPRNTTHPNPSACRTAARRSLKNLIFGGLESRDSQRPKISQILHDSHVARFQLSTPPKNDSLVLRPINGQPSLIKVQLTDTNRIVLLRAEIVHCLGQLRQFL